MDAAETEKYVGDLEIAVDRLRSLYEQYFMGIEKLEPTVPRKDVDRRIYVLRKEQIRNTAQRFRFQMILQKYNTYQTHWMRICREIENGTYKRHLIKARQRFGDDPARASAPAPAPPAPVLPGASPALASPGAPAKAVAAELAELDEDFAPMLELDDDELMPLDEAPAAAARKAGPVWRKAEPTSPRGRTVPEASPVAARSPQARVAPVAPAAPARPAQPAPVVPGRTAPPRPTAAPAPAPAPAPRPAPAPAAAPRAAPPAPLASRPAPPPTAAARAPSDLPDERVRQLYAQYVETKRQQKESTAAITYDAVAKSLRDSSAKLREKHGKNVDFEVSVKDGKTILKPVLK